MSEFLKELVAETNSQDNAGTAYPIIVLVQELKPIGVMNDDYKLACDGITIEDPSEECRFCTGIGDECNPDDCPLDNNRMGYAWVTVTFCFTVKGAEDYFKANGHNHGELRTFIDHISDRNVELQNICKELKIKSDGEV
jgi:hypothetical protein